MTFIRKKKVRTRGVLSEYSIHVRGDGVSGFQKIIFLRTNFFNLSYQQIAQVIHRRTRRLYRRLLRDGPFVFAALFEAVKRGCQLQRCWLISRGTDWRKVDILTCVVSMHFFDWRLLLVYSMNVCQIS